LREPLKSDAIAAGQAHGYKHFRRRFFAFGVGVPEGPAALAGGHDQFLSAGGTAVISRAPRWKVT
jgi:hypothetical protein